MIVTDKQIFDELRELATNCLKWAKEDFPNETNSEQGLWARSYLIYLEGKVLNHSPKYYRDKELRGKQPINADEVIIREEE